MKTSNLLRGLGASLLLLLCACTVKAKDEDSTDDVTPPEACEDMAGATAEKAASCGYDYQANYRAFVDNAAGGDCDNITSLRDEASLYADCIPYIQNLTCSEIANPNLQLPDSCIAQLLR